MEAQEADDNGHSANSDEYQGEPAEKMVWGFHYLHDSSRRSLSSIQPIRSFCPTCNVEEIPDLGCQAHGSA